ncbi:MAG: isoprenyl transferase [Acidobacteria bacterium]|nr:isoprenyl transferase [Acidobacteriota bacterium]MBI3657831.1 isoprenyl transferase [Acidobacteriota bacterium]
MANLEEIAPRGSRGYSLLQAIDFDRLPQHIAVIMDGNGRWAAARRLPRVAGHRAGIASVKEVVETSARLGIRVLTLYAFSVENWKRPKSEISTLMSLLKEYLQKELSSIIKNNIRFCTIGRVNDLAPDIQQSLQKAIAETSQNNGMIMNIALNYGGRAELVDAFQSIMRQVAQNGHRDTVITEQLISDHLYTSGLDDPDLLIRTSGEMRISNFLLWQIAYAEIWMTPVYWPDFRREHLLQAIVDYQKRDRRYGGL